MKKCFQIGCGIVVMIVLFFNATGAFASESCRAYTDEQRGILELSYRFGEDIGLGYTLAAIAQNESFYGKYVTRINPRDVNRRYLRQTVVPAGSYGITHILLSTAILLDGGDPTNTNDVLKALQYTTLRLQKNDDEALFYSYRKLQEVKRYYFGKGAPRTTADWHKMWAGYNSYRVHDGKIYADRIAKIVSSFIRCKTLNPYKRKIPM